MLLNESEGHLRNMRELGFILRRYRGDQSVETVITRASATSGEPDRSPDWYRGLENGSRRSVDEPELRALARGLVPPQSRDAETRARRVAVYRELFGQVFPSDWGGFDAV